MSSGWERVSENTGGTVAGLANGTLGGQSLVFAATPVGVYRSSDAGVSWVLPGVHGTVPFAESVVVSPRFAQDRLVLGGGSDGLYRSADGGETWQRLLYGSRMLGVAVAASEGTDAVVLAATENDGVLRSDDGGATWSGANAGLLDLTAMSLGLSPRFATDRTGFVGTASGLYRTRNGARSWRVVETGLNDPAVQALAVSPAFADDRLVLAGTEADGLLRSDDAGATWHVPTTMEGRSVTALAFSASYPAQATIAAATESGIAISRDAGQTWQSSGSSPGRVLSLAFLPDGLLLAGLEQDGVARSSDAGATWTLANAGLSARLLTGLCVSPDVARDQTLFAVGLDSGVNVSVDGGQTWVQRNAGLEEKEASVLGLAVSASFADDQTLYAATSQGVHVSRDGAATWTHAKPDSDSDSDDVAGPSRAVAAGPVSAPKTVVSAAATGKLFASDDAGATWRGLSARFDGFEITSLALSPGYALDRTIFVVTGRSAGIGPVETVVWRTVDGGERWVRWLVEPGPVGGDGVVALAVSPNFPNDQLVFVGIGGRVLKPVPHAREVRAGERRPVWRGVALSDAAGVAVAVTALAASPGFAQDRTLLVATNVGVFVSRDAGDTYQPWSEGLIPPRTVAIAPSPTYHDDGVVFGLALGGALWRRTGGSS